MYFSFVSPFTESPAKKTIYYMNYDWGEAMAPVPPGYALVAHFIIKLSSFNVYRNSLNCISSVTEVKYLHFIGKMNGHIL